MPPVRASLPPLASSPSADRVLETLLLPLQQGQLALPAGQALFLRARATDALRELGLQAIVCEQGFKPDADALLRAGFTLRNDAGPQAADDADHSEAREADASRRFALVLVLPPRQREEARALLARAVDSLAPGGVVLVAMANDEGARSGEADLERLVGPVGTLTKNKCRAYWSAPCGGAGWQLDTALLAQWRVLDALRPVGAEGTPGDGRFVSRPGLFAWDRVDPATELLAAHVPADMAGRVADLGAGHGMLAALLLARCRRIKGIDLFEAELRALDAARINLARWARSTDMPVDGGVATAGDAADDERRVRIGYHWHDVTTGVPGFFDAVVSNPPFHHVGRAALPEVGRRFILAAAAALRPGGSFWMVANRNLPYEAVLAERFGSVRIVVEAGGYKVIEAIRAVQRSR
jgi:16S rRNA (guanine1207-N2)-methyltransferase